jgi:serine/tyrosine/threonine adenylyltransferase
MNSPHHLHQKRTFPLPWHNSFAALPDDFFTHLKTTPLPAPYWVGRNPALASALGLDAWLPSDEALQALTGNAPETLLPGSQPLASVYSGHQFGQWAGQLGDGRAILLGELSTPMGLQEIQLKGAGRTPYSRGGDGRAVLRSSIREFLCSEAMHGLGIPTTRALCVTGSDAMVQREIKETAAVVTRLAPSFIRFGHFEHFSYNNQHEQLKALADYVIDQHYPACRDTSAFNGNPYAALLQAVSERTAKMVAHWQAVGFCHGVMNTDNMSILGLTIDYGPFQFLDTFDPQHICNHSDTQGRYAYNKQPNIAYWNLFCLGQALLPLISPTGNSTQDTTLAVSALESYKTVFPTEMTRLMRAKLGLGSTTDTSAQPGDRELIESILQLLATNRVDYTIFWRQLSNHIAQTASSPLRDLFLDRASFDTWMLQYSELTFHINRGDMANLMLNTNPKFVLRNHLGEQAIRAATGKDCSEVERLRVLLASPYDEHPGFEAYANVPPDWAAGIEISCSS